MQTSTEIIPLFSSPVYVTVDDSMPDVVSQVESLEYQNHSRSIQGGSQTINQNILHELPEIQSFLESHVKEYVYGVMGISEEFFIDVPCSWVNCHKQGDMSHEHSHRNSMYSGIVYLKTHPNCGDLVFIDQSYKTLDPTKSSINVYNAPQWSVPPVDGMVVIFPSHLVHSVKANQDTRRRYSLAFNIMIRGDYGNATSYLTL